MGERLSGRAAKRERGLSARQRDDGVWRGWCACGCAGLPRRHAQHARLRAAKDTAPPLVSHLRHIGLPTPHAARYPMRHGIPCGTVSHGGAVSHAARRADAERHVVPCRAPRDTLHAAQRDARRRSPQMHERAECCKIAQNVARLRAMLQQGAPRGNMACCSMGAVVHQGGGGLDHAAQPRDEPGVLGVLVPHCATGRSSQRSVEQTRVRRRVGAMTRYPRPHGMATARIPCGTVSPHWDTLRRRASHIGAWSPTARTGIP